MAFFKKTKQPEPGPQGKFIVIEGADGTGKSTQIQLLAKTLDNYGYDGLIFNFPQYSKASAEILKKYTAGEYGQLNPEATSIIYALDRFDVSNTIREHLNKGEIVLADRYSTSNAANQGAKLENRDERIKFYKWLDHLEFNTFNIPKPDLTIILHCPVEFALQNIAKREQSSKSSNPQPQHNPQYLTQVEKTYSEIAGLLPNTKLIECVENGAMLTPQEIHAKVWELIRRMVLKNNSF